MREHEQLVAGPSEPHGEAATDRTRYQPRSDIRGCRGFFAQPGLDFEYDLYPQLRDLDSILPGVGMQDVTWSQRTPIFPSRAGWTWSRCSRSSPTLAVVGWQTAWTRSTRNVPTGRVGEQVVKEHLTQRPLIVNGRSEAVLYGFDTGL